MYNYYDGIIRKYLFGKTLEQQIEWLQNMNRICYEYDGKDENDRDIKRVVQQSLEELLMQYYKEKGRIYNEH